MKATITLVEQFLSIQFTHNGDYAKANRLLQTILDQVGEADLAEQVKQETEDIANTGLTLEEMELIYFSTINSGNINRMVNYDGMTVPITYYARILNAFALDATKIVATVLNNMDENRPLGIKDPLESLNKEEEKLKEYLQQFQR